MGKESLPYGYEIYFSVVYNDWWYNLPLVKIKENSMRLNINLCHIASRVNFGMMLEERQ